MNETKKYARKRDNKRGNKRGNKRVLARLRAVQALYQLDVAETTIETVLTEFAEHRLGCEQDGDDYLPADVDYFNLIIKGVRDHQADIDPKLHDALSDDWPLPRINATLRAILRAGAFEALYRADTPMAVVVAEYMDIAQAFFDPAETKIVHAVLDKIGEQSGLRAQVLTSTKHEQGTKHKQRAR